MRPFHHCPSEIITRHLLGIICGIVRGEWGGGDELRNAAERTGHRWTPATDNGRQLPTPDGGETSL